MYLRVSFVYVRVLGRGWVCLLSPLSYMPRAIKSPLCWWTVEGRQPLAPRIKIWVGGGTVKVGIKGRAVRKKIKKPSDLFVRDDCAAQWLGWYLDSGIFTLSNQ